MKPLRLDMGDKIEELLCEHQKSFPPPATLPLVVAEVGDIETQRKNGNINDAQYNQALIWQRVCGLQEMDIKCLKCPHCKIRGKKPSAPLQPLPPFYSKLKKITKA